MNEITDFIDVSSTELGRWLRLQHVPVPATLQHATFNQVEIPAHLWEAVVRRPDVTVANVSKQRDVTGAAPRVADALLKLAEVFESPELSVYIHRQEGTHDTLSVGVSRGSQGILVVDMGEVTRLAVVPAGNLVAPLVGLHPRPTPARVRTVELSSRERDEMSRSAAVGRPDEQREVLRRRGMDEDEIALISEPPQQARSFAVIGAFSHRQGQLKPSPVGADWVDTKTGSYLKLIGRHQTLTFLPADRAALLRAASAALAAAN